MISKSIIIKGAVQGVGFRPFVYKVAKSLNIKGTVNNSAKGVEIIATGEVEQLDKFVSIVSLEKRWHKGNDASTRNPISELMTGQQADNQAGVSQPVGGGRQINNKSIDSKSKSITNEYINNKPVANIDIYQGIAIPTKAHIEEVEIVDIEYKSFDTFTILKSGEGGGAESLLFVPTDLATCPECEAELFDKTNRRYLYPFINCTNCGPRYSIVNTLPYDREATSMKEFKMCPECQSEYDRPDDRRFHAEPNACSVCGPQVYMTIDDTKVVGQGAVDKVCELINAGEIVAIKGLGGYQLLCDATIDEAVAELRLRKSRPTKPFAIMCLSVDNILNHTHNINQVEIECLVSEDAPIVLLDINLPISSQVSNSSRVGIMLAYTPLHKVILNNLKSEFIIATSGNLKGEPIVHTEAEANEKLSKITKYILHNNRGIVSKVDDSVVTVLSGQMRVLRRGRGFAPYPVKLPVANISKIEQKFEVNQGTQIDQSLQVDQCLQTNQRLQIVQTPSMRQISILGVGAHLKNTITFLRGQYAYVSQYIGDLESVASVDFADSVYNHLKNNLNIDIDIVARDMHRGYLSSAFAEEVARREGAEVVEVQHHHAHTYSVMAEHGLVDNLISIVLDGTGYGEDGNIWGGEVFALDSGNLKRVYHLEYVPQLAGDVSAKFPSVMAQSYLLAADEWDMHNGSTFWQDRLQLSETQSKLNESMWKANINSTLTSSAGRLFEGVGAMLLGIHENEYEAHSAIVLEDLAYAYIRENKSSHTAVCGEIEDNESDIIGDSLAQDGSLLYSCSEEDRYKFDIDDKSGEIRLLGVIKELATDIKDSVYSATVAYSFHIAFAKLLCESCERIRKRTSFKDVVLSGGVFQNKLLLELTESMLKVRGFSCYSPLFVPANDGGISLGQVYYTLSKKLR